jgi:hypothetical protein
MQSLGSHRLKLKWIDDTKKDFASNVEKKDIGPYSIGKEGSPKKAKDTSIPLGEIAITSLGWKLI